MIGRGASGYRGIGYDVKRKTAPWRVKVGKKTVGRFAKLEDACVHVADHAHVWYPGHAYKSFGPNEPTTDPEQPRVGRTATRSVSTNDPSVSVNDPEEQTVLPSDEQTAPEEVPTTAGNTVPKADRPETIASVPKAQDEALMDEIMIIADDQDPQIHKI